jgi:pimeloyl-ACP methyl ester carboxylesterase
MPQTLPLVLISGAMSTRLAWRNQVEAFGNDHQIVIPDHHYSLTSIQDMARDIAPRLPDYFDLIGWSMGGYIVFELYPLVRERVRKVVLISTSARPEDNDAANRRIKLLKRIEAEGIYSAFAHQIDCNLVDRSLVDAFFRQDLVAEAAGLGKQTLDNQSLAMMSRNDARLSLGHMTCEVLVIAGRYDTVTPLDCSEEIASLLPRAELYIVDNAAHCAPWEKPTEVNNAIRRFLCNSAAQ